VRAGLRGGAVRVKRARACAGARHCEGARRRLSPAGVPQQSPGAPMASLLSILYLILDIAFWIIIVQAILSWLIAFNVINMGNDFVRSLYYGLGRVTEPVYRPIRKILPNTGPMDLSPLVVLIGIYALRIIIANNIGAFL
jgi:YggT family protein